MSLRWLALVLLLLGAASLPMRAQSIIRVGVIDQQDSPITRGAQLAAAQINAQGGIRGADGTPFTIKVVATPPDNMTIAAANMAQANVIAILLPASWHSFSDLQPLLALDLPMLTDAPGDSVLLQDSGGRLFRSAAPELTRNRALAAYLVNSLGAQSISTVQLDAASTASLIGFAAALSELGVGASNIFYDESRMNLTDVVLRIMSGEPDAVGLYGPPLMAAQVYSQLRRAGYAGALSYGDAADSGFADFVPAELLPGVISATKLVIRCRRRHQPAFCAGLCPGLWQPARIGQRRRPRRVAIAFARVPASGAARGESGGHKRLSGRAGKADASQPAPGRDQRQRHDHAHQ